MFERVKAPFEAAEALVHLREAAFDLSDASFQRMRVHDPFLGIPRPPFTLLGAFGKSPACARPGRQKPAILQSAVNHKEAGLPEIRF